MEPYLYHGIRDYNLDRLINILKCGFILPKKMLGEQYKIERKDQLDLTGDSWISFCQKSIYDENFAEISPSSFDRHVFNHMCAVVDFPIDNLEYTIHRIYDHYGPEFFKRVVQDNNRTRYSVYSDEVQTDKPVPTSKFLAIGYPREFFLSQDKTEEQVQKELKLIRDCLDEQQLPIPIIDSSHYDFADTMAHIKKYTIR